MSGCSGAFSLVQLFKMSVTRLCKENVSPPADSGYLNAAKPLSGLVWYFIIKPKNKILITCLFYSLTTGVREHLPPPAWCLAVFPSCWLFCFSCRSTIETLQRFVLRPLTTDRRAVRLIRSIDVCSDLNSCIVWPFLQFCLKGFARFLKGKQSWQLWGFWPFLLSLVRD